MHLHSLKAHKQLLFTGFENSEKDFKSRSADDVLYGNLAGGSERDACMLEVRIYSVCSLCFSCFVLFACFCLIFVLQLFAYTCTCINIFIRKYLMKRIIFLNIGSTCTEREEASGFSETTYSYIMNDIQLIW